MAWIAVVEPKVDEGVDLVALSESEHIPKEAIGLLKVRRCQNDMTESLGSGDESGHRSARLERFRNELLPVEQLVAQTHRVVESDKSEHAAACQFLIRSHLERHFPRLEDFSGCF